VTCEDLELLLADRTVAADATLVPGIAAHVKGCEDCRRLLREVDQPAVFDALDEAAGAGNDLPELTTVAAELYVRGKEIGRGGMGRIVRAHDRRLGRSVAIKELLDARMRARFEREARLTARLQHPAIVSIHEAGVWPSGEPFYAMKYVAGRPLSRIIEETRAPAERLGLLPHVITVVEAIAYAHSERVIHRDLKPHNILVGAFGETVVIDWGLAKDLAAPEPAEGTDPYRDDALVTRAGAGTPAYMPPEQARGDTPDERVDVYALGATLYHVIAGKPPVAGRPLAELAPSTPPELLTIVAKAMAPEREERYPDARALAADLRRFQSGQLVGAHRYTAGQLARRWLRRHRFAVGGALAFAAALAAVGVVSVARIVAAQREATAERDRARRGYAEMLLERGRQETVDGSPARGLVYLHAALEAGLDTPALRVLLGQAGRTTDPLLLSLDGRFTTVALDEPGALLATGSPLRLWDVANGRPRPLGGDGEPVAFAGRRLLSRAGARADLWDVDAGSRVAELPHAAAVEGGAFSHDGSRVVTWAGTHAMVWAADGHQLAVARGHERDVQGAAFDAAGERILTGSSDRTARVWEAATGRPLLTLGPCPSGVAGGAFDPRGDGFATAGWDQQVTLWDGAGRKLRDLHLGDSVRRVTYSPDGRLVLAHGMHAARLWRADSGELVASLATGSYGVAAVQFLGADATRVLVVARDGSARVFDTTGAVAESFDGHPGPLRSGGASADGGRVVSLGADRVVVWQTGGRAVPRLVPHIARAAAFDGRDRLVIGAARPAVVDASTGRTLAVWPHAPLAQVVEVGFEGDRVRIVTAAGERRSWNLATGEATLARLPGPVSAVSGDGRRAVVGTAWRYFDHGSSSEDAIVEVATGRALRAVEEHELRGTSLTPDGARIATVLGGVCEVRETDSGRLIARIETRSDLRAAVLSPDGSKVVLLSHDLDSSLWDVARGEVAYVLRGHADSITSARFSSDGALLFTGGRDGRTLLWDVADAQVVASWTLPGGAVTIAAFDAHDRFAYVTTLSSARILDARRDPRTPAEIARAIGDVVPFALDKGRLVARRPPALARPAAAAAPPPVAAVEGFACPPATRPQGGPPPLDRVLWCSRADGAPAAPKIVFWPNGQRMVEVGSEGARITTERDEAGRLATVIEHRGRETRVTHHHPDGSRAATYTTVFGALDGEYLAWYPSGALRERADAGHENCGRNGCTIGSSAGTWTTYREDGGMASQGKYYAIPFQGPIGRSLESSVLRIGRWTFVDATGARRTELFPCHPAHEMIWGLMEPKPECE
jgi:serine/threonine protein kinase/WD40 repeat protein